MGKGPEQTFSQRRGLYVKSKRQSNNNKKKIKTDRYRNQAGDCQKVEK